MSGGHRHEDPGQDVDWLGLSTEYVVMRCVPQGHWSPFPFVHSEVPFAKSGKSIIPKVKQRVHSHVGQLGVMVVRLFV